MTDETIFATALDKADPAERAAFLAEACGDDPERRKRLEGLLMAHTRAANFLERPPVAAPDPDHGATQALTGPPEPGVAAGQTTGGDNGASDDEALTFLAPPTRPDALGRLGHYEVLQVLGRGGFGIVFRAFDQMLQRVVALKVMAPQLAATSPARKRFLREAQSSAKVRHENVVQVYEVAEQPLPYLAMEFIPGETLQQKLDRVGPLDVPEVLCIGRQIAEGLAAAHATDLIHRDIKPGNVLLEGGQQKVKITDFGLARTADDASISQSGIIAGTPMYMAPEQALGQTLDQRADLFSLGSVLYQMVAGRPPFRANSAVAVLKRVAEDKPRAIREIIPEAPQWLCDIIAKLHAKDPADRYQSAREVADVLADCEEQLKANAKLKDFSRIPKPTATPRAAGRRRWVAAAAVLLLPVIALSVTEFFGVTHLFRFERDPMTPGQEPRNSPEVPRTAADVLPFLAGNWKMERQTGDPKAPSEKAEFVGHLTYDFVAGGKFLRGRGDMGEGRADLLFLFDFDPGTNGLHWRQAWSSGLTAEYISGQFLADTRTLMFSHRIGALDSVSQFYFVDANTFIHRYFFKDQGGTITRESKATFARTPGPAALRTLPADPGRPAEMKVLDRLVGEWRNEITRSVAGPDTKVETLRVKAEPILGGRFIEKFETNEATGVSDYTLSWFDTDAKAYRTWFFNHSGSVTEFSGAWDEAAKTLTWNSAGGRLEGRWTFKSADLREYRHMVKDKDGKVLNEAAGVSRRTASAALPAEQQVEEVRKELMKRNPGFDGKMETKIEGGVVTELRIVTDRVTDIVPIRVFNDLRRLDCSGTRTDKPYGLLADLTPLGGMRLAALTYLNLCDTKVGDAGLAHIEDCKALTALNLGGTKVSDAGLAKFKDCKNLTTLHLYWTNVSDAGLVHFQDCKDLTDLSLAGTKVSDVGLARFKDCKNLSHLHVDHTRLGDAGLTHFKGLRLTSLWIYNTRVTDLTLLQGMPLEDILLTPKSITRGLDILRGMKSLKTIGVDFGQSWPAAEFWERYDKGEFKD